MLILFVYGTLNSEQSSLSRKHNSAVRCLLCHAWVCGCCADLMCSLKVHVLFLVVLYVLRLYVVCAWCCVKCLCITRKPVQSWASTINTTSAWIGDDINSNITCGGGHVWGATVLPLGVCICKYPYVSVCICRYLYVVYVGEEKLGVARSGSSGRANMSLDLCFCRSFVRCFLWGILLCIVCCMFVCGEGWFVVSCE